VAGLLPCGRGTHSDETVYGEIRDIDSDGKRPGTAADDEVQGPTRLDALTSAADEGAESTTDAPAPTADDSETDDGETDGSDQGPSPSAADAGAPAEAAEDVEARPEASKPAPKWAPEALTVEQPVVDLPFTDPDAVAPAPAAAAGATEPAGTPAETTGAASGPGPHNGADGSPEAEAPARPGDTDAGTAAGDGPDLSAEPAVTRQMPVVDAPAPVHEPQPTASGGFEVRTTTGLPGGGAPDDAATTEIGAPAAGDTDTDVASGEHARHFRGGRIGAPAGPADIATAEDEDEDEDEAADRHLPTRNLALMVAPVVVLALLIVAWAVDTATHSGQVLRNVELAGQSIDGISEDALPEMVSEVAVKMAARKVTVNSGDRTYETTAGELGLAVDQKATIDGALDVGRGDSLFVRPLKWLGSFFTKRKAPIELTMSESQTAATLQRLQGADRTQPVEPMIQLTASGFVLVPGLAGIGIDIGEVTSDLRKAAEAEPEGAITLDAEAKNEAPAFSDRQAQDLADRANEMTADGLTLQVEGATANVPAQTLRGWVSQAVTDGKLDLAFNAEAAKAALPMLLGGMTTEPKNATVTLENGQPVVKPSENGVTCCGDNSGDLIWQALKDEKPEVALEAQVKTPELTTEAVTAWGVKQPVGGNRGFRDGADIPGGLAPGFTTYHGAGEARNTNIERIADEVRGAVIPPGSEFSINDRVGKRSYADGYVDAGAIREGLHVAEVGGGISQFSTTMFNAAYFAGLDILESQSHSEWFTRYPPGREATMGFPNPDLRIRNNTPYGVLVWTSYTPTSITVTLYSTPHATGEQTNKSESMNGSCRNVVTTRTRTYPDGTSEQDQFKSTYRPEGKRCDGSVIAPPPPAP